jgi:hypothetical protein
MSVMAEMFQNAHGRVSLTRLMFFLSFFPATYIVVKNPTEGMLGLYLGAFAVSYVSGKGIDAFGKNGSGG